MSQSLIERRVGCPFCGESLDLLIDASPGSQHYIEDCHVCCQPIEVTVVADEDTLVGVEVSCGS